MIASSLVAVCIDTSDAKKAESTGNTRESLHEAGDMIELVTHRRRWEATYRGIECLTRTRSQGSQTHLRQHWLLLPKYQELPHAFRILGSNIGVEYRLMAGIREDGQLCSSVLLLTCHTHVTRAGDAEQLRVGHGQNPAGRNSEDNFDDFNVLLRPPKSCSRALPICEPRRSPT